LLALTDTKILDHVRRIALKIEAFIWKIYNNDNPNSNKIVNLDSYDSGTFRK
jgi:hypothetical protein